MPDDGFRYELIRGVLIRKMPPGDRHGDAAIWTGTEFANYVRANNWGGSRGNRLQAGVRPRHSSRPGCVLDCAGARAPEPIPGYRDGAPDLAVEVKSPNDSRPEMFAKAQMWIGYGTRIVLVLDPAPVTVTVYRPSTAPVVLGEDDALDLGDLLPGFSCPVWRLFRQQR